METKGDQPEKLKPEIDTTNKKNMDSNANVKKNEDIAVSPEMVTMKEAASSGPASSAGATPTMINADIKRTDISRSKRPVSDRLSLNPQDDLKRSMAAAKDKVLPIIGTGQDLSEDLKTWFSAVSGEDIDAVKELVDEGGVDVNVKNEVNLCFV